MEYRANVDLTYDDFLRWIKVNAKTSRKTMTIISNVFIIIATIAMAAGLIILAAFDAIDTDMIIMLLIFLLCFTYLLFRNRLNARISQKSFMKNIGTLFYTMNDDGIFVKTLKSEERYYYSGITAIYTAGDTYFILLDKNHALILPKRGFVSGAPESFEDYITSQTGLTIETVKC